MQIPTVDVGALFGRDSSERRLADRAIMAAASEIGFMSVGGLPARLPLDGSVRANLLRLFGLPESARRALYRRPFAPDRPNVYRGFFPAQPGGFTFKEGIDIGPDLAFPAWRADPDDPLTETTPLPGDDVLPGWRTAAADYYRTMLELGRVIMASLARGLGLPEITFDAAFAGGISTLRLLHYPTRTPQSFGSVDPATLQVEHQGERRHLVGAAHVDSGFVTLLAQDGVPGLQARGRDGAWIDIPPIEGTLAINFGGLVERWTGGRIRATEHRVISPNRERFSIPFFYEPRVDAVIAPLDDTADFTPFSYGDHLWAAMCRFVEFRDIADLRKPRGIA